MKHAGCCTFFPFLFFFLNMVLDRMLILAMQMSVFSSLQNFTNHIYELLRSYGSSVKESLSFCSVLCSTRN